MAERRRLEILYEGSRRMSLVEAHDLLAHLHLEVQIYGRWQLVEQHLGGVRCVGWSRWYLEPQFGGYLFRVGLS